MPLSYSFFQKIRLVPLTNGVPHCKLIRSMLALRSVSALQSESVAGLQLASARVCYLSHHKVRVAAVARVSGSIVPDVTIAERSAVML